MPVSVKTVTKPVVKAKVKLEPVHVEPAEMPLEDIADRYGDLQDKLEALKMNPLFAQFAEIEAELKKRLAAYGPLDEVEIKGKHWIIEAGACSKIPRKITDVTAIQSFLDPEAFAAIAKVGVTDAEKYLTPDQFAAVSWPKADTPEEETFTKNRKVTAKFYG